MWELACRVAASLRWPQLGLPDVPRRLHRSDAATRQASSHRKAHPTAHAAPPLIQPLRSAVRPPCSAFDLFDLDLGAPLTTLAARGLESVGNPAGRRVSRAGPRMAHRGGPRIQVCVRAHRAGGEVPSGGARALWLLWCFSKVTRCKSETNTRHNTKTGYTPTPPKKKNQYLTAIKKAATQSR